MIKPNCFSLSQKRSKNTAKDRIAQAFSAAAAGYDQFAALHRQVGTDMLRRLPHEATVSRIIDVGLGTGQLTRLLQEHYPGAKIIGIDLAAGMLKQAGKNTPGLMMVRGDADRLPFKKDCCHLVYSNLALQWVADLESVLQQIAGMLHSGGLLSLSLFGRETLAEFFMALEKSGFPAGQRRLLASEDVHAALNKSGLQIEDYRCRIEDVHYPDLHSLLKWLKQIGANRLNGPVFLGREKLRKAEQYYRHHFADEEGLRARFDIITFKARKLRNP